MAVYLEEYLDSIENCPLELRHHLSEIRTRDEQYQKGKEDFREAAKEKFDTLKRLSEEKSLLSDKLTELINKHVKRLDEQILVASKNVDDSALAALLDEPAQVRRKRKIPVTNTNYLQDTSDEDTDDYDEETYCICQRPSFGEMVMCDNEEKCPYVWFHIGCVGLSAPPVGTWYCPTCSSKLKKK